MGVEGRDASIIRAGAVAIREWRQENVGKCITAERVIVCDLDLSGADLSLANLTSGRFKRCILTGVSFINANLDGAEFDECELNDADFHGASLTAAKIKAKKLNGAKFGNHPSISRIAELSVIDRVEVPISVNYNLLHWWDRWISWDRLRFLATIRIFVPAYASLALTIFYLNGVAWYNSGLTFFNVAISGQPESPLLPVVVVTWVHALILVNFLSLGAASTCFLSCPARVIEFSRERWLNEFNQPEILYDYATWQRPIIRIICAFTLFVGGLLSTFLLGRGILQQVGALFHASSK